MAQKFCSARWARAIGMGAFVLIGAMPLPSAFLDYQTKPAAAAEGWTRYRYGTEGFSIEFPGMPPTRRTLPLSAGSPFYQWIVYYSRIAASNVVYSAQVSLLKPDSRQSSDRLLGMIVNESESGCGAVKKHAFDVPDGSGREVRFERCEAAQLIKSKFLATPDGIYRLDVFMDPGTEATADADRFLNSFAFEAM